MVKIYVKKPIPITALQWTGDNVKEMMRFSKDIIITEGGLFVKTLEGDMHANVGDYVVRGVRGEFWPVKKDIFEETYEEISEKS